MREDLHHLVDQLAETELEEPRRLLKILKRDVDDDPISDGEMAEIQRGANQIERGYSVPLDKLEPEIEP